MPTKVDMCEHYTVEMTGGDFQVICLKGHRANLKCHSEREDCPDYHYSVGYSLEETKSLFSENLSNSRESKLEAKR